MTSSAEESHDEHERTLLERLTFFSDAVFAIAMTLLVIDLKLPHLPHATDAALGQALVDLMTHYIGFVASFLVIGRFWVSHHELFGMLDRSNMKLVWANLFFLLAVAFTPFPTAILSEYASLRVGVGFYTVWLMVLGCANVVLTRTALAGHRLLRTDVDEMAFDLRRRTAWVAVVIGGLSFAAGMIHPLLTFAALAIGSPLVSRFVRHLSRRVGPN